MDRLRSDQRRWGKAKLLRSGQLVRELRESAGITAKVICSTIGMAPGQLSDIERGIQSISLRRAHQIAEVLEKPVDHILAEILREKLVEAGFRYTDVEVTTNVPMFDSKQTLGSEPNPLAEEPKPGVTRSGS